MRISELAAVTGVTIPTIKFYLREGLLPSGVARAANQADYDETHVRRLRLKVEDQPDDPKLIVTVRGIGYRLLT